MPVTADHLGQALRAVGAGTRLVRPLDELARDANASLLLAPPGLTGAGCASYVANAAQESDYFRSTREYRGDGADYFPYVGATFEMITWQRNYGDFGAWLHERDLLADPDVFVRDPGALTDYRWAWLGCAWYFEQYSLWRWANLGDHYTVSQAVNRGPNSVGTDAVPRSWAARLAMYTTLRVFGDELLPERPDEVDAAALRRRRSLLLHS